MFIRHFAQKPLISYQFFLSVFSTSLSVHICMSNDYVEDIWITKFLSHLAVVDGNTNIASEFSSILIAFTELRWHIFEGLRLWTYLQFHKSVLDFSICGTFYIKSFMIFQLLYVKGYLRAMSSFEYNHLEFPRPFAQIPSHCWDGMERKSEHCCKRTVKPQRHYADCLWWALTCLCQHGGCCCPSAE